MRRTPHGEGDAVLIIAPHAAEPLVAALYEERRHTPYPTSRQLDAHLEDPPLPARTFGRLLALLVELEIIELYTERSSANRYDIRAYDAVDLDELETLLA
ncbi:hypothetical protein SAMN04487948_11322 [Halogranum amylolyticum]|uniref:Uncharacterized protein n=1 Tax=Halogranum amylolyticum TaxID=660520 RepID=A0A1H8UZ02_9EURY|nr:hypothetical protein [Halogranum amylolyticum]SEP07788.1 hypothetical protein SAMN04487948_11322 [Halogranum amylolyticum]